MLCVQADEALPFPLFSTCALQGKERLGEIFKMSIKSACILNLAKEDRGFTDFGRL